VAPKPKRWPPSQKGGPKPKVAPSQESQNVIIIIINDIFGLLFLQGKERKTNGGPKFYMANYNCIDENNSS